jgi:hypothetical protein
LLQQIGDPYLAWQGKEIDDPPYEKQPTSKEVYESHDWAAEIEFVYT